MSCSHRSRASTRSPLLRWSGRSCARAAASRQATVAHNATETFSNSLANVGRYEDVAIARCASNSPHKHRFTSFAVREKTPKNVGFSRIQIVSSSRTSGVKDRDKQQAVLDAASVSGAPAGVRVAPRFLRNRQVPTGHRSHGARGSLVKPGVSDSERRAQRGLRNEGAVCQAGALVAQEKTSERSELH